MRVPLDDLILLAAAIDPLVETSEPADPREIISAEATLGVHFPGGLRQFLSQSDGATIGVQATTAIIHTLASDLVFLEIVARNRTADLATGADSRRASCSSRSAGVDGLLFGHAIADDGAGTNPVVVYYPIDELSVFVAPDLRTWLVGWLDGSIVI